jgi:hypothetical protein
MASTTGKIAHYDLVWNNGGILQHFGPRALKRKKWDFVGRDHNSVTTLCWKGKRGKYITLFCS